MTERALTVRATGEYRLFVELEGGLSGEIDIGDRLHGSVFLPLKDPAVFRQVHVDSFGAVCWPNGADLAPETLYDLVASTNSPREPQRRAK